MLVSSGSGAVMFFGATIMGFRRAFSCTCLAFQLCVVVQLFQASKHACVVPFAPSPPSPSGTCGKYMYVG